MGGISFIGTIGAGWLVDRGGFLPPGVKIVLLVTIGVYVVDVIMRGRIGTRSRARQIVVAAASCDH